jgi:hypothetical protein
MTNATTATAPTSGGDLSRRVATRREELGLSLHYLETNSSAHLSTGSLILLAMALKTTPDFLQGGHEVMERRSGAGQHPTVQELSRQQCMVHLENAAFGRVVYITARGPVAVPVNYEFTDSNVIISTDTNKAKALARAGVVGFEVDQVDQNVSEGWSVLLTGPARRVTEPHERMALSSMGLESWSGNETHDLVAIEPREITGRVIIHPMWTD